MRASTLRRSFFILAALLASSTARRLTAVEYPLDCANNWRVDLHNPEGEWLGYAKFEVIDSEKMLYIFELQENAVYSMAEISLQAAQPDSSLLSLTLSLPLCTDLLCPEPFFFQTSSTMMQTLISAVTLGLARLTIQTSGPYSQRLYGDIALDCDPAPLREPRAEPQSILCPLPQAPVAYRIPQGCSGVQERLQTHCGLNPQAVALASGFLYSSGSQAAAGFGPGLSVCLPEGCRPCEVEAIAINTIQITSQGHFQVGKHDDALDSIQVSSDGHLQVVPKAASAAAQLMVVHQPACAVPGFTVPYDIPQDCTRFSERAAVTCGLSTTDLAAASAQLRPSGFAGFAPGQAVCLPEGCDPCSSTAWTDSIRFDALDADRQARSREQASIDSAWGVTPGSLQRPGDAGEDFEPAGLRAAIGALLKALQPW